MAEKHVLDTYDPRILYINDDLVTNEVREQDTYGGQGLYSTQHVLSHLAEYSPACAGARYLLVTTEDTTYAPAAFNVVQSGRLSAVSGHPDIVGLHFATNRTMASALDKPEAEAWDRYCTRLGDKSVDLCAAASPDTPANDLVLGAKLLNLPKILSLVQNDCLFSAANSSTTPDKAILDKLHTDHAWTWAASTHAKGQCDLVRGPTYESCGRTGRIWLDMPTNQTTYASGCMSLHSITRAYGWLVNQWDMEAWRANPFCLRLSKEKYGELLLGGPAPVDLETVA